MQPQPIPHRRNTLTKPGPNAPNSAHYPSQMAIPGTASGYLTTAPQPSMVNPATAMPPHNPPTSQRPYLAAEMAMMQDALKIAALRTAEAIRYMTVVRRAGIAPRVERPPSVVANELRTQLARYDQLCDLVETRLVRAHAALSARLARERAANPHLALNAGNQKRPISIDSPGSDDVPLSISTTQPSSKVKYTPAPKSRGLASLATPHPPSSVPGSARAISPVTLASNAAIPPAQDTMLSHHTIMPGLMEALRRQEEQEQARSALHRPPGQEAIDMLAAQTMEELFMSNANTSGVDIDIDSAVAGIDASVSGMDHIDSSVSNMHSAVPDMNSAVAELDSAVAEMASVGDLNSLGPHTDDPLFADLHANTTGDNSGFGTQPGSGSFANDGLQDRGFSGESIPPGDPFTAENIPAGDFANVSGTGEDSKGDLLADLDAGGSNDMDLQMNMDLIEIGELGIAANEMGQAGENVGQDSEGNLGEGGIGIDGNIGLGDVDISGGDINMNDVEMMGGDDIVAMWSNPLFFDSMDTGIGDGIQIKTEQD
ncbi:hypothetical protein CTheo_2220 [Ceratobasidium theobromae]|uniref:Uncharacterized protein n=1 Tax=Ceratobasidium theobromae TaxID=1582974 RepID=A0A5N5QRB5_9AGAM|nr:hypothetical protein CTheo_2220 [Ceratobasidium theobromae]